MMRYPLLLWRTDRLGRCRGGGTEEGLWFRGAVAGVGTRKQHHWNVATTCWRQGRDRGSAAQAWGAGTVPSGELGDPRGGAERPQPAAGVYGRCTSAQPRRAAQNSFRTWMEKLDGAPAPPPTARPRPLQRWPRHLQPDPAPYSPAPGLRSLHKASGSPGTEPPRGMLGVAVRAGARHAGIAAALTPVHTGACGISALVRAGSCAGPAPVHAGSCSSCWCEAPWEPWVSGPAAYWEIWCMLGAVLAVPRCMAEAVVLWPQCMPGAVVHGGSPGALTPVHAGSGSAWFTPRALVSLPAGVGDEGPPWLRREPPGSRAWGLAVRISPCPPPQAEAMSGGPGIYHERQHLELCAVHALNNVLQEQLFTQEAADEICKRLAPDARFNPHRSLLGTGNYDVNVIMAALQSLDLAAIWWDKRRPLEQLALSRIHGFIVNIPSNVSLGFVSLPVRRKHWIAVRQVGGVYYNLDSKLKAPACVGGESELRAFLQGFLSQGPCEVLLVVSRVVEETGAWLTPE